MRATLAAAAVLLLALGVAGYTPLASSAEQETPRPKTTPLVENGYGNPKHPLTNLPSTNLAGVGKNAMPGIAFYESAKNGVTIRVQTEANPAPAMTAEIDQGKCPNGGKRLYALRAFTGNASITTLRGVGVDRIRKPGNVIRVIRGRTTIECGPTVGADWFKTHG